MSDQQQTYAVARIMAHRQSSNGHCEYFVRWKDENNDSEMTADTDTWEPTSSFVDGEKSSAIQEYWAQQNLQAPKHKNILPATIMVQPNQAAGQFLLQPVNQGPFPQQIIQGQPVTQGQIIQTVPGQPGHVPQVQSVSQAKIIQQVQQPIAGQQQVLFLQSPTQPGRIIQQQPLNIQMGPQGPIQYILSPSHQISSPITSPVPLNQINQPYQVLGQTAHTPGVIKSNNFSVIKTSPVQISPSRTPRRTSESSAVVKTEQSESPKKQTTMEVEQNENVLKSPSYSSQNDLSMLADAAMEYMSNPNNMRQDVKTDVDEPPPLVPKTEIAPEAVVGIQNVMKSEISSESNVLSSPPPLLGNAQVNTAPKDNKKRRGRPPGLTKAKLEERKKAREAEAKTVTPTQKDTKKRGRGRPPKTAAEKTKELVLEQAKKFASSSDSSNSDSSSDQSDEDNTSDSSDDDKQPKIKPSGESLAKFGKKKGPLKSPPGKNKIRKNSTASENIKSPEKSQRRDSITSEKRRESISSNLSNPFEESTAVKARRESFSKTNPLKHKTPNQPKPTREVTKVEDLKWAIKTMTKKDFVSLMKINEKPSTIGCTPGQLMAEMDHATSKQDIGFLTRRLVGCSYIKDDGSVYIPDEINGKKYESALVKAAQKPAKDGGPALINALCGVGGADPNQKSTKENTALHEAALGGHTGNVAALLGYHSQINWKNSDDKTALHLAVTLAKKWEKFSKMGEEFKDNCDNAYACVELLLAAGADPTPDILHEAEQAEVADILHWYEYIIKTEVYNFIKRSMGKISLDVHDKLLASVNCVPADQNMIEIVIPEIENFPPNVFLIMFAVHGEHEGFGMDFNRLKNLRLSGNPCLIEEVIWHKPRIGSQKEMFTSLDGLQSVARKGPFEPGKGIEQYGFHTFDSHYITLLEYVPYRKNKYTLSMVPAYWGPEKVFIRVYPCELTIAAATFEKRNPEVLRYLQKYQNDFKNMNQRVDQARKQWQMEMKKECEILKKGVDCPGKKTII